MSTPKLLGVKNLTHEKYLNLQELKYDNGVRWVRATRDSSVELERKPKPTAVQILVARPDEHVLLTREFRYSVNSWVIGTPAGLIDEGETPVEAAQRELREETGLDVPLEFFKTRESASYLASAGLTDEMTQVVLVELPDNWEDFQGNAEFDHSEMIETFWWNGEDEEREELEGIFTVSAFIMNAMAGF